MNFCVYFFIEKCGQEIRKILIVDYPRGKPRELSPTFFQRKAEKTNFHYFAPLSVIRLASPLIFRGEYEET